MRIATRLNGIRRYADADYRLLKRLSLGSGVGAVTEKELAQGLHAYLPFSLRFDEVFYRSHNNDLPHDLDLVYHYLHYGWKEGRSPNPFFDPAYHAKFYSEQIVSNIPYLHFIRSGWKLGEVPLPDFDPSFYRRTNPDLADVADADLFLHFCRFGDAEGRACSEAIERTGLSPICIDVPSSGQTFATLRAARSLPRSAGARPALDDREVASLDFKSLTLRSGLFDDAFYYRVYPDVPAAGWDALEHFTIHGAREFRDPNEFFVGEVYAYQNPGYDSIVASPFEHFLRYRFFRGEDLMRDTYTQWLNRFDELTTGDLTREIVIAAASSAPLVLVVANKPGDIARSLKSVAALWTGRSVDLHLLDTAGATVRRVVAGSASTNSARPLSSWMAELPSDRPLLIVFDGAIVRPHAHFLLEARIAEGFDLVYCDNDLMTGGRRSKPDLKPAFSPRLLRDMNYMGEVFAMRVDVAKQYLRECETVGSLTLVSWILSNRRALRIGHVPYILYHLERAESSRWLSGPTITKNDLEEIPLVSIIIPTRDQAALTESCILSVLEKTEYPLTKIEILLVDNGSTSEAAKVKFYDLQKKEGVRVEYYGMPFNFAAINNFGRQRASGEVLVFLNNDTVVCDPLWLKAMVAETQVGDVAAVGAMLLYEDGTVQHGGTVVGGAGGMVEHLAVGSLPGAADRATRECSAVTGACLAVRKEVFDEVGGFDTVLKVAFNDVKFCLSALDRGYRNIYIARPLMYHFESKSRGFDTTKEKVDLFYKEAAYARQHMGKFFLEDPFWSPNKGVHRSDRLAQPPRRRRPWLDGVGDGLRRPRALLLSVTHNRGYGVPVVLRLQALQMVKRGYEVFVGGPRGETELDYPGCRRVYLTKPETAASFAFEANIDVVVPQTPPFFSITRYIGPYIPVVFYDYGEPNAEFFADPSYLEGVQREKRFSASVASKIITISESVRKESFYPKASVAPLGNSHLAAWQDTMSASREKLRSDRGWTDKFVVMNVCRFARLERSYKGLNKYIEIAEETKYRYPHLKDNVVFALAGAASPDDIREMENQGLEVFPNVSDETLIGLYGASDMYMSFSRWEGYNLGIGQALAMGLRVVASNIEAHRAFPIQTTNSTIEAVDILVAMQSETSRPRKAVIFDWTSRIDHFIDELDDVLKISTREKAKPAARQVENATS